MDYRTANIFTNIEKGFNVAGSLPVVSLFSGSLRALAGKIQFLVGAVIASIGAIGNLCNPREKWAKMTALGSELVIHGALNALRGFGEALICVSTLIGNIFLLIPNMVKEDMFSPYFSYGSIASEPMSHRFSVY